MKRVGVMAFFTFIGAMVHRLVFAPVLLGRKQAEEAAVEARRQAEERTEEILTLKSLAETLNQTLPPEKALEAGLALVARRYGATAGWLLTLTADRKADLSAGYNLPPNLELAKGTERPWGLCNCMRESLNGRLAQIRDFDCERLSRTPGIPDDQKHHLSIPIRAGGVPVGILNLVIPPHRHISEAELRLMSALGDQFGGAVERAQLFKEVQKLAMTDPLTGLFNRRHFFAVATRELERARRYNRSLSVAILDIDHFKNINDEYGHLAGDQALIEVARVCQHVMRRIDTIGRFGGEEIVILMPETTQEQAQAAMERLRHIIEQLHVKTPRGTIQLTVSIGVTRLPENESFAFQVLLDQADQALYQAKNNGRNQVRFSRLVS